MITKEKFLEVVNQYNLRFIGIPRKNYLHQIISTLKRKEILILKGVRRCGKTTILKQIIQHLVKKEGVKKEDILYVNLDDFNFLPYLSLELLELMLNTRSMKRKQYIFLDEIQKIPNFESWLRTQYDKGINVKFIISGSNSSLLSKDLATLLTGRNLTFEIYPLDYKGFKVFTKSQKIDEYLEYGGFPEVVLEKNKENKLTLLRNYVSDIINKDIILRKSIREQKQLVIFAQYILQNPGVRLSINKLSKQTSLSKDTVKKYLDCMIDAYLIFEVPFFSYSAKSKFITNNISKYYVLDLGFYRVNSSRQERGKIYENITAQNLYTGDKNLTYWKGKNEVDFVSLNQAYNVTAIKNIPKREIMGLQEIRHKYKTIKNTFILYPGDKKVKEGIHYMPINEFLLGGPNPSRVSPEVFY